ncbi:cytochrome P450 [Thamnidium elegans]|uniref:Cytochrome P450 n=1 Tax=Thamnidium elegans TaxID=101142 RepID=A0A8H7SME7_9FUNG|nr:hypothetical protein INT48_005906 [Thamnidium elegans]KAI8048430.1 cytochrome P450 [Thamnidium elegans]BDB32852.1 cytochrome P450 monooxygenase [Thamnidium elegans]
MEAYYKALLPYKLEKEKALPAIAVTLAVLYVTSKLISSSNKKPSKEIPMHKSAYPYIGHLLSLGKIPSKTMEEWHNELGPIMKIKMGAQTWISIDSPRLAHQLLVINGSKTSSRPESYFSHTYSIGEKGMIFSPANKNWKKIRSAVSSAISPSQINIYLPSIENQAKKLVDRLIETTKKESGVHPYTDLQFFSVNTIFAIAFGRKFESINDPDFKDLKDQIEESMAYSGIEYDLATYLPIFSIYDFFTGVQAKIRRLVEERRNPSFQKFIKEGLQRTDHNLVKYLEEGDFDLSQDDLTVAFNDIVGAGTDTIAVTLTWNITMMVHHPQVQLKAQEEIDRFIKSNDRLPTINDKEELPYCFSVIKESMRYKSTVPYGLPHLVDKDVQLGEYLIEKGTVVVTSMNNLQRNPEFYPDMPESFVPERYMNNLKSMQAAVNGKLEERDHFAFGWGRRICPGISLAEAEIFAGFVSILSRCSIVPTDKGMPDINGAINCGLTVLPLPFKVKFVERSNSLIK